jgi:hypothetical protein
MKNLNTFRKALHETPHQKTPARPVWRGAHHRQPGRLGACAQRGPGGMHGDMGSPEFRARMVEKVGSRLDQDAAQKQKLAVLADKLHAQRTALRGAARRSRATPFAACSPAPGWTRPAPKS